MCTLLEFILTKMPSLYTSAVFNQNLNDHCLIAYVLGPRPNNHPSSLSNAPLKHFREQAFLIDLARVSWKDFDLIPSVEDAWLLFKSAFLSILNKHAPFKKM